MGQTRKTARATLPAAIGKVLKRLHYPLDVILPSDVEEFGEIVPLTLEVHRKPAGFAQHFGVRFYDSCKGLDLRFLAAYGGVSINPQ
jgi:hypothetical protein